MISFLRHLFHRIDQGRVKRERIIFDEKGEVFVALRRRRCIAVIVSLGVGAALACDALLTPIMSDIPSRAILTFVLSTAIIVMATMPSTPRI